MWDLVMSLSREGTTAEKESGSIVRGTKKSNRAASFASAEIEVRAGAVLLSGCCAEYQTISPLPQPTKTPALAAVS
jgi:hypothetical protein